MQPQPQVPQYQAEPSPQSSGSAASQIPGSAFEPGIIHELVEATDRFADIL